MTTALPEAARTLQSLDDFNRERLNLRYSTPVLPVHNGIACPKCGKELFDTDPQFMLMSNPPQKNVHCECGYSGYRFC